MKIRTARVVVVVLALALVASRVDAQSGAPGPGWVQLANGGWVDANHPDAKKARVEVPSSVVTLDDCRALNPYVEPDRVIACLSLLKDVPPSRVDFVLGGMYGLAPYMSTRTVIVIGKSLGVDGVEVITAQIVLPETSRGEPIAFFNDGSADAARWVRVK